MFCPKCSQPQSADEMRYCPRCGFPLAGVKELLAGGGVSSSPSITGAPPPSPRQHGIRQGARLLFWSVVLLPLFWGVCFIFGSPLPLVIPASIFLAGLVWMIYARLFGESFLPSLSRNEAAQFGRPADDFALPAHPRAPAAALGPQHANTAEMIRPASVADHTTNLLDRS